MGVMAASFIVAACRTPIGKMLGNLSTAAAPQLGAVVIREAMSRAGIAPEQVDEVVMGNVLSAGIGQAPARQAALDAGCSPTVAALTINKMCGSGLKAVMLADQSIRVGDTRVVAAGGMESMSRAPHLLMNTRLGWKFGHQEVVDSMLHDGLWCAQEQVVMGCLADATAGENQISREEQDAFAVASHRRAIDAIESGRMTAETVPVEIRKRAKTVSVTRDEGPRADVTLESLAALRPAFDRDGTATAGNASQISDGAAAVIVVDEATAGDIKTNLKARIVATAVSGVAAKDLFIAPVLAMKQVLDRAGMSVADLDLIELNEAFASQALACLRPLGLDHDKVNVNGGAIALGHPIGASGARVLTTLLYALAERDLEVGMAALCLGGGNAVAIIVQRV
jgi:acetyl-CoA C-acetyltransferase